MPPTDAELVREALAGSQAACHALVVRYASAAVNVAARLVNDRGVAEELDDLGGTLEDARVDAAEKGAPAGHAHRQARRRSINIAYSIYTICPPSTPRRPG